MWSRQVENLSELILALNLIRDASLPANLLSGHPYAFTAAMIGEFGLESIALFQAAKAHKQMN